MPVNFETIPSPCFVLEERLLKNNLKLLRGIMDKAEVDIIVALKGYAMWSTFPTIREYLAGATASSLHEARLVFEEMGVEAHTYAPAYLHNEFDDIMRYSSHITFNSLGQWERFKGRVQANDKRISCGLRVNPEYSEVEYDLYNACTPGSRLGITIEHFGDTLPKGIEGLHFHALCESNSYILENTIKAFEEKFGQYIPQVRWVNMGGGHLITREGYDVEHLIKILKVFREKWGVQVILEPGEAIGWETGYLKSTVLDVVENRGVKTAILDVSFTAHMPDTLEMPYLPRIQGTVPIADAKYIYRMGGLTCLSGDYKGDYGYDHELKPGDTVIFNDMIHYTMVKTSTFNGVKLPSIGIWTQKEEFRLLRSFGYDDFKYRLS